METTKSTQLEITPRQQTHQALMLGVLKAIQDTPLVLKGGTALYLCYGLTRFSEDLDFDAPKKMNLSNKLGKLFVPDIRIDQIITKKDTDTVSRYAIHYTNLKEQQEDLLKLEVSYRTPPEAHNVVVKNNIAVLTPTALIENKLLATHDGDKPRVRARDLFDLHFLVKHYREHFTDHQLDRLSDFAGNPDRLLSLYSADYHDDALTNNTIDLETIVLELHELTHGQCQDLVL